MLVDNGGMWFDERAAGKAVAFFERVLKHSKGEWEGQPFLLQGWQRGFVRELFGWKRGDGTRRYRRAYLEVPRKNGKSTLAAGIALMMLYADGEPGAEIYSAASDRDQAAICFDQAKAMVEEAPALLKMSTLFRRSIVVPGTRSSYKVLSAEAYSKHGLNAHGVIFDELHAQPSRELWDVLTTATGARRQPLVVAITTAGYDRESICWEVHEYARQVAAGIIEDSSFLPVIYAADELDDWTNPAVWAKANPGLGATVKTEYIEEECRRAVSSPNYQNAFRRLHLNQWTQQESRWLDMRAWDACAGGEAGREWEAALAGRACYAGLDLASTTDLAALALVFPALTEEEPYRIVMRYWTPGGTLRERALQDRAPYVEWSRDGWLAATPGDVIDYVRVRAEIERLSKVFNLREVAFDRWGAVQMSQELMAAGLTMIQFGQGYASMSAPAKDLERLMLEGKLAHGGQPVLRWNADNVTVLGDAAGNIKPDKARSTGRIDGVVALIMALDRALRHAVSSKPSVYAERGLRTV